MEFTVATPLVLAAFVEERRADFARGVGAVMVAEGLAGDFVEADAADAAGGLLEVFVDERLVQADRLEDLRAAVALDRTDAHLGHHFDDALLDRLPIFVNGLGVIDIGLDDALLDHLVEGLEGDIGVDRARAVAEQEGEMVDFAGVAAFDDQAGAGAHALADEVVVQAGGREQARGSARTRH